MATPTARRSILWSCPFRPRPMRRRRSTCVRTASPSGNPLIGVPAAILKNWWALLRGGGRIVRHPPQAGADLLRDIVGPLPFRSVRFTPSWLTPPVQDLAETANRKRLPPRGHLDNVPLAV